MVAAAMPLAGAAGTAGEIIGLVVIGGWILLFAILIGLLVTVTLLRGARQRRQRRPGTSALAPARPPDPQLPARLADIRRADPDFDEQLLLEAAQMASLLIFAARSTGDEQAIRQLAAPSFWSTLFGRYIATTARDARQRRAITGGASASRRQARLPIDFQATAPELVGLELGPRQLARVRVSFSQLGAIVAAGAAGQAGMASATNLKSLGSSFGGAMGSRMNDAPAGVSWVAWAGRYDLDFTRPAGSRTDPRAALASRTCAVCGAAYRSEFATTCAHCGAPRPAAWGDWRLAQITAVEGPRPSLSNGCLGPATGAGRMVRTAPGR
jgi:hypothetical protein